MAQNRIFKETERKNRARVVPAGTKSGDPLLIGDRPAVAITDRGDGTRDGEIEGSALRLVGIPSGGVGLADNEATVAFDGTWEFAVTGATTNTAQDSAVYRQTNGTLTTTEGTNVLFGHVDYPVGYFKTAGRLPVRIGD